MNRELVDELYKGFQRWRPPRTKVGGHHNGRTFYVRIEKTRKPKPLPELRKKGFWYRLDKRLNRNVTQSGHFTSRLLEYLWQVVWYREN